jgi:hypothetical protein
LNLICQKKKKKIQIQIQITRKSSPVLSLLRPARRLLTELSQLLSTVASRLLDNSPLRRYPALRRLVHASVVASAIADCEKSAWDGIAGFLEAEAGYVWTEDEGFKSEVRRVVLEEAAGGKGGGGKGGFFNSGKEYVDLF